MTSNTPKRKNIRCGILSLSAALSLLLLAPSAAFAHTDVFLGLNPGGLSAPLYAPPPTVVYTPPPRVYYAPTARTYYAPTARTYYAPRVVHYRNGWRRHERFYRDDYHAYARHRDHGHDGRHHWRH